MDDKRLSSIILIESSTCIIAPILGGALLQQIGNWAPGAFGAIVMLGVTVFVWFMIFNHPALIAIADTRAMEPA